MDPEQPDQLKRSGPFATLEEARQAILGLRTADYAKLMLIAQGFARKRIRGTVTEPDDLIHDAISKTLDGRRKWNLSVSIVKHLDRIMESDSGHVAEQAWAHRHVRIAQENSEILEDSPGPATITERRDTFHYVLRHFGGDEEAMAILRRKANGLSASEIRRELGMGKTQYETVTRRIRRQIAQHVHTEAGDYEQ